MWSSIRRSNSRSLCEFGQHDPREHSRAYATHVQLRGLMLRDLKLATRTLARRPLFFLSAVLTLGLGFGAAVSTFAVVDRLLLRPLDYPNAERLVFVTGVLPGDSGPGASLSVMDVTDIRIRAR